MRTKSKVWQCVQAMRMMLSGMPSQKDLVDALGVEPKLVELLLKEMGQAGLNIRTTMGHYSLDDRELLTYQSNRERSATEQDMIETMEVMVSSNYRWKITTSTTVMVCEPYMLDNVGMWVLDTESLKCMKVVSIEIREYEKLRAQKIRHALWKFPYHDAFSDSGNVDSPIDFSFNMTVPCMRDLLYQFPSCQVDLVKTQSDDYPYALVSKTGDLDHIAAFLALHSGMVIDVRPAVLRRQAQGIIRIAYDNIMKLV